MRYLVEIHNRGTPIKGRVGDTRAELAEVLDQLYQWYPRAKGFEYTVICEVTTRYTLVDSEVLATGDATQDKLWAFVTAGKRER